MNWGKTYVTKTRSYSEWARKEIALAEHEPDPYLRRAHMDLADSYIRLAELELMTAMHRLRERERHQQLANG